MNTLRYGLPTLAGLLAGLVLIWLLAVGLSTDTALGQSRPAVPRFTEEREAAALHFVRKHLPELLPVLDELKKSNARRYQNEIGTLFQATEYLAELRDNPRRHDLELKIWKAENRAYLAVARLAVASEAERKTTEMQLQELVRELVDLDIQVLKLKSEQLTKELADVNAALSKSHQDADKHAKERFDKLLEKVKKPSN
jgi:hypothetical protein